MTVSEMQLCAEETLDFFFQTMLDIPFAKDDIVIEFVPKGKMVSRYKALCSMYAPDKKLNDSKEAQLASAVAANAIIGRDKSAVLVRVNPKNREQEWRQIIFHELMHIFCAKSEMDEEHFIDIYGSGHTPDMNPADKTYDGFLNAGYVVWSEFIAQYYALIHTQSQTYTFGDVADYAYSLLDEVSIQNNEHDSKTSFAMACSYLLTCDDGNLLSDLMPLDDAKVNEQSTEATLRSCLGHIHRNLQEEKPWKISEEYIAELGSKYLLFRVLNSIG